jgi:hypothetical protein
MQKFSGIYMGRRKKQTSETEAEMEGSGDDIEPQGLAILAQEFRKSINQTESTLVTTYRRTRRQTVGMQAEISETLRKVDENQTRIAEMLMAMNHKGKGPESYSNKETSGSHGGNRYQQEHIPYHYSEGSHGGGAPQDR